MNSPHADSSLDPAYGIDELGELADDLLETHDNRGFGETWIVYDEDSKGLVGNVMEYLTSSDRTDEEKLRNGLQREIELSVGRDQYSEIVGQVNIQDQGDRAYLEFVSPEYEDSLVETDPGHTGDQMELAAD